MKILHVLLEPRADGKEAKTLGYIAEHFNGNGEIVRKGFTVEETIHLIYNYGCENATARYGIEVIVDPVGMGFGFLNSFAQPIISQSNQPHCLYSASLTDLMNKYVSK